MNRVLLVCAVLVGVGCSSPEEPRGTAQWATTAVAMVSGRIVTSMGAGVAGATVRIGVLPHTQAAFYEPSTATADAEGRFQASVFRKGGSLSGREPDTASATIITTLSSTNGQLDTIPLYFNAMGAIPAMTVFTLRWRGPLP
jgi:hypothetical protein